MNLCAKISTKNCGITPRQCEDLVAKGETVEVLAVVAKVSDAKVLAGDGEMKDSVQFTGNIAAKNVLTGEDYRSRKLFLPSVAEDFLFTSLQAAKQSDPNAVITARIIVTVEPHNSAKGGYKFKYGAKPFDEPKADDLTDLLTQMTQKALPKKK